MVCGRAILVAILSATIAACGTNDGAPPTSDATPTGEGAVAIESPTVTPTASPVPTASPPSISPSPDQQPDPTPTPIPVPPKPTGVKFDEHRTGEGGDPRSTEITQSVTWRAPRNADVEVRVYGVLECIAEPKDAEPNTRGPCLVTGTPLPASTRTLLATAPASDGTVSWSWTGTFDCGESEPAFDPDGPRYRAIVLAAYNASGHSIFAIAAPGSWWKPDPGDIIC